MLANVNEHLLLSSFVFASIIHSAQVQRIKGLWKEKKFLNHKEHIKE